MIESLARRLRWARSSPAVPQAPPEPLAETPSQPSRTPPVGKRVTRGFNEARLVIARRAFGTEWPARHREFFLRTGSLKVAHLHRKDGKTRLAIEDALTYAFACPGSAQAVYGSRPAELLDVAQSLLDLARKSDSFESPLLDEVTVSEWGILIGPDDRPRREGSSWIRFSPYDAPFYNGAGPAMHRAIVDDVDGAGVNILSAAANVVCCQMGDVVLLGGDKRLPTDVPWVDPIEAGLHNESLRTERVQA